MKNKIIFAISCTLFFVFSSSTLAKTPPKKMKPFVELIKEIPVLTFPLSSEASKDKRTKDYIVKGNKVKIVEIGIITFPWIKIEYKRTKAR